MRTADFDYTLPPELIAQFPAEQRDASRLLVLDRATEKIAHQSFRDFQSHLRPGDVLVLNNSRVIPARLRGVNEKTGGQFEVLLLEENSVNDWWVMLRPGKRAQIGTKIIFCNHTGALTNITAEVIATNEEGHRRLRFDFTNNSNASALPKPAKEFSLFPSEGERAGVRESVTHEEQNILDALDALGELPLPPYIERAAGKTSDDDLNRYQTVFAQPAGSVAAPTAGLHFTPQLLDDIRARGIVVCFVTLHVGLGTFAPVKADSLAGHVMHEERYEVSEATAAAVNAAKREGRRVIAVGTTSVRVLESAAVFPSLSPSDGEKLHGPPSLTIRAPEPAERGCPQPQHLGLPTCALENLEVPPAGHPQRLGTAALRFMGRDGVREMPAVISHGPGRTRIFIHPPYQFKIVDALLTNFHLPRSTLLMLVSAFAAPGELRGRDFALRAYNEAVRANYRFFSYGDAMLIL